MPWIHDEYAVVHRASVEEFRDGVREAYCPRRDLWMVGAQRRPGNGLGMPLLVLALDTWDLVVQKWRLPQYGAIVVYKITFHAPVVLERHLEECEHHIVHELPFSGEQLAEGFIHLSIVPEAPSLGIVHMRVPDGPEEADHLQS